jgi:hypothetical protein
MRYVASLSSKERKWGGKEKKDKLVFEHEEDQIGETRKMSEEGKGRFKKYFRNF